MAVQSLSTTLQNYPYLATDSNWVRFIKDHKEYLKTVAQRIIIDKNNVIIYRNKVRELLITKNIVSMDKMWIVFLLNDINTLFKLNSDVLLYIPTDNNLKTLKDKYNTYTKKLKY